MRSAEGNFTMKAFDDIIMVLLTTGIATTLIASIFNIILSLITNKNVKALEKIKKRHQSDFLRFEKINEVRLKLENYLIFSPYDIIEVKESSTKSGEIVTKLINDCEEITNLFDQHAPFFDKDIRMLLEDCKKKYRDHRWELQKLITARGSVSDPDKFDKGLPLLFDLGNDFRKLFESQIEIQLNRLDITD